MVIHKTLLVIEYINSSMVLLTVQKEKIIKVCKNVLQHLMNPGNMVLTATKIVPYPVNVLWMTMYTLAQVIRTRK